MNTQTTVLNILQALTGEDLSAALDTDLFATALLDSMDTVQLLLELQDQLGISVPVSEFDRNCRAARYSGIHSSHYFGLKQLCFAGLM